MRLYLIFAVFVLFHLSAVADGDGRYIEVSGTSEMEIVPDEIHYIIEIKEYFKEELDKGSKPEDYFEKVSLDEIEQQVRKAIANAGVSGGDVRVMEIGSFLRERGKDFLVSKRLDITLRDFDAIERIRKNIDTHGISAMYIGELKKKDHDSYQRQGRIDAIRAARRKAEYMASEAGCRLGKVLRVVEAGSGGFPVSSMQRNVFVSEASSSEKYRTIKKVYTVLVRYELAD